MQENKSYPYTEGDLLRNPQKYQYTSFGGLEFLHAWKSHRKNTIFELEHTSKDTKRSSENLVCKDERPESSVYILKMLLKKIQQEEFITPDQMQEVLRWVQKFEVNKRIYATYNSHLKVLDKENFLTLEPYFIYARLICICYEKTHKIQFLNVYLKMIDTLISQRGIMNNSERAELLILIENEILYIETLANVNGIKP
jgi:hypothetical protein